MTLSQRLRALAEIIGKATKGPWVKTKMGHYGVWRGPLKVNNDHCIHGRGKEAKPLFEFAEYGGMSKAECGRIADAICSARASEGLLEEAADEIERQAATIRELTEAIGELGVKQALHNPNYVYVQVGDSCAYFNKSDIPKLVAVALPKETHER